MKKTFFTTLAVLTLAAFANAQSLHLGAKLGANLNKIDGVSFKDGYELGYQLGGFLEFDFNEHWGIQPEVLFSQTTTTVDSGFKAIYANADDAVLNNKLHLGYLNIPILLRINAGSLLTFHAGPQFSVLINRDKTLLDNGERAFKNGDFALVAGAQVNLKTLRIYGRYNIGLSNINDIDDRDEWKSQQLQLGIGFRIL